MYQRTTTAAANQTMNCLLSIKFRIIPYYIEKKVLLKTTFDLKDCNIL